MASDGTVLMVGYMNQEAINKTPSETRSVHFESLTPNTVAEGRVVHMFFAKDLFVDCDRDTILVEGRTGWAHPVIPASAPVFSRMTEQGQAGEEKTQDAGGGIQERSVSDGLVAESPSSAGSIRPETVAGRSHPSGKRWLKRPGK